MLAVFGLGGWEVVLILAVVLILFGAKKLPELAKGLGTGIKEFKKATKDVSDEMHRAMEEDYTPPPPPPTKQINPPSEKAPADSAKPETAASASPSEPHAK
jgi:sec-independent protein translocase protein TatA